MEDIDVTLLFDKFRGSRQVYKLLEPIHFIGWEHRVCIKTGFQSDLVSLPRILQILASPTGRWAKAAIVHDFLYRSHYLTRREADQIFYKIMKDCGVPTWKRKGAYTLVRLFGKIAYKRNKRFIGQARNYGYVENISR